MENPQNIISIEEYLERKTASTPEDIKLRLADIAIEQALLSGEKAHLLNRLKQNTADRNTQHEL